MTRKILFLTCLATLTLPAHAYVGPGLGVGVIGALFGLIMTVLLAFLGLFWYPIKKLFRKKSGDVGTEAEAKEQ